MADIQAQLAAEVANFDQYQFLRNLDYGIRLANWFALTDEHTLSPAGVSWAAKYEYSSL
jgi:hypothetical protein